MKLKTALLSVRCVCICASICASVFVCVLEVRGMSAYRGRSFEEAVEAEIVELEALGIRVRG